MDGGFGVACCVRLFDGMGDGALGQVVGRYEGRGEVGMLKAGWVRGGGSDVEW